jgi:hypothetical protein
MSCESLSLVDEAQRLMAHMTEHEDWHGNARAKTWRVWAHVRPPLSDCLRDTAFEQRFEDALHTIVPGAHIVVEGRDLHMIVPQTLVEPRFQCWGGGCMNTKL